MASFTFNSVADLFGVGTSVGAYLPNPIPGASSPVTGAAVTTAVVAADGSLAFSGLADDTAYVAYDSGSGKARRFRTPRLVGSVVSVAAPTGDATGAGDTALLAAAIATAKAAGGGRVLAKAGVVYQMGIGGSITVKNPSGSTGARSYSLLLPSNVTLDGNGSTLRLMGSTQCTLVMNEAIGGTAGVRDTNIGLVNAVLDNRSIAFTTHSMLQLGYIDGLTLRNVTLSNGIRANGWVYDVTRGVFDDLDAHDIQGQAWTFGDPQATGLGHNGVYDSQFGRLRAHDITLYDTSSQPGNPYNLVLYRCTMESVLAKNCSGGVKLQQPSEDVAIGKVVLDTIGEASALQGGFKLQGDATYPAGTDRPKRIKVGQVIVRNCVNLGLYLFHTEDCSIESYTGYGNVTLHTANSDVFLGGGVRDVVGSIISINSGGAGLRFNQDNGANAALGFRIGAVKVINPGQQAGSAIKSGVRVDTAAVGSIGDVVVVDNQGVPTLTTGFEVTNASAVVAVGTFSSTGHTVADFTSNAAGSSKPVAGALTPDVQVFTASGTWTKPSGYTSTKVSLIAAGGGGGSGARGPTATARVGGGAGAGGAWSEREFKTSDLTATVAVTIGAPGTGGAAQTVDGTAGVNGTAGGVSQFGAFLRAGGGGLGTAGGLAGAGGTAGTGGTGMISGANGGAGAGTGGAGGAGAAAAAGAGGGAGGGVSSGNVDNAGGAGSPMTSIGTVTGTGGAASGGAGVAGAGSTATNSPTPGGGGGGGAGSSVGAAGNGGAGGNYGAGGGGGGASLNGFNSGAGGNGAGGICVVISY